MAWNKPDVFRKCQSVFIVSFDHLPSILAIRTFLPGDWKFLSTLLSHKWAKIGEYQFECGTLGLNPSNCDLQTRAGHTCSAKRRCIRDAGCFCSLCPSSIFWSWTARPRSCLLMEVRNAAQEGNPLAGFGLVASVPITASHNLCMKTILLIRIKPWPASSCKSWA